MEGIHRDADSIVDTPQWGECFVEPATEMMNMETFLGLVNPEDQAQTDTVYYCQSQNGNLLSEQELSSLFIGHGPAFSRQVFGECQPDCVNALHLVKLKPYLLQEKILRHPTSGSARPLQSRRRTRIRLR